MADNTNTISTIKIKATADTSRATANVQKLADSLQNLRNVAKQSLSQKFTDSVKSLADMANSLNFNKTGITKTLVQNMNGLADAVRNLTNVDESKLRSIAESLKTIGEAGQAFKYFQSRKKESGGKADAVGKQLPAYMQGDIGGVPVLSNIKRGFADIEQEGRTVEGTFKEIDTTVQKIVPNWVVLKNAVKKVESAFKSLAKKVGSVSAMFGKALGNVAFSPWKRLGSTVVGITKRFTGFFSALKRIAIYRAIRTALKEIVQGFREGMANLYQYSLLMDGQFAKSMDSLATSALYLKNSLGAMTAPIVNALAPAVDYLTDRFVELLNVFNQLVATLTGASTWTKALKYPKQYAEAMDGASGSAKELRATLLGFDEINRLDDNSRGSRGSASDLLDYSKMFEEAEVDNKVKTWVDKVKDAFKKADFTDIGESIGNALKKGLDSIKWDSIKERAKKNAESFATLINGFVNVDGLGASIGYSIAQAMNVAIDKMFTFFNTVDWGAIGRFLGEGFNKFTQTFDIVKFARTMAGTINSALATLGSFLGTVNWSAFGKFMADGINNFLQSTNAKQIAVVINNGILGALKTVQTMLSNTDFKELGRKIGTLITNIDWGKMLKETAKAILLALRGVFETLKGLIESDPSILKYIGLGIAGAIAGAVALQSVKNAVVTTLTTLLTNAGYQTAVNFGKNGAGTGTGGNFFGGLFGGILGTYSGTKILEGIGDVINNTSGKEAKDLAEKANNGELGRTYGGVVNTEIHTNEPSDTVKKFFKSISANAGGGTVNSGDLFFANENGVPELIASVGNKTQVANQDQIIGAIEQATVNGNAEGNMLLRQAVSALQALLRKDTTVVAEITTDSITNGLARQNLRNGRTTVAVGG